MPGCPERQQEERDLREPMNQPSTPSEPTPSVQHHDAPCLACGYNLRGLSGDPIRCPECGADNYSAHIPVPGDLVEVEIVGMHAGVFGSALVLGFVLVGTVVMIWAYVLLKGRTSSDVWGCCVPGQMGAVLLWAVTAAAFGRNCGWRPGWFWALMRYQLTVALMAGMICGMIAVPLAFMLKGVGLAQSAGGTALLTLSMTPIGAGVATIVTIVWHGKKRKGWQELSRSYLLPEATRRARLRYPKMLAKRRI